MKYLLVMLDIFSLYYQDEVKAKVILTTTTRTKYPATKVLSGFSSITLVKDEDILFKYRNNVVYGKCVVEIAFDKLLFYGDIEK